LRIHHTWTAQAIGSGICLSLLVVLNNVGVANLRIFRITPNVSQGSAPAQEVPALIELNLDLIQPFVIRLAQRPLTVELVFFGDQMLDMIENLSIFWFFFHIAASSQPVKKGTYGDGRRP
jgi:hypothetical protein